MISEKKFCCVIFLHNFGKIYNKRHGYLLNTNVVYKIEFKQPFTYYDMKKTLLLGMLLLAGLGAQAQDGGLPNGTAAPDFTATDIEGKSHHLQEYLDQGKTVVLYISATWCGPCWQFHNTHYLRDVYESFGAGGSDEVVILYVEGDNATTMADLQGTGSNTQGDWITGSPYPIIDNGTIAGSSMYKIKYFPTIYRICPGEVGAQGTATQISRGTPADLLTSIETDCHELVGLENFGQIAAADVRFCGAEGGVKGTVTSLGADITSATVNLKANGEIIATETFEFTQAISAFGTTEISFEDVVVDSTADYQMELTAANGGALHTTDAAFTLSDEFSITPNASTQSNKNVKVTINTDNYPSEIQVYIVDQADTTVAAWGQTYANTAANKNKTFEYYVSLNADACYDVLVRDAYGDGWIDGTTGNYGMKIESGVGGPNSTVLYSNNGAIGLGAYNQSVFNTNDVLGNETFEQASFSIYPNPSTGVFNFTTQETVSVTVVDITGKTVYTATEINDGGSMNLSALQSGMYIAKVKGETTDRVEKLILK